ncbi:MULTISPECIES: ATP-binding cassette domain-containing protein [Streptomyces]|uniref:ATP-binding cassette domain-containing protein n=1 Tax=Streptomyces TaxID=1883 RepID=UPI000D1C0250|nr:MULTISPECIES: ATP-binding cassette domain-containing protein [Streptomyces]
MRLTGVGRRYGRRRPWVLRGVGLDLPPGALVRIEGGNGGGKSTLLRLLAGIDAPTEGRITGRPRRTAYVPERFPAVLPLTALGYLTHLGRVHGLTGAEAARRGAEGLERFGAGAHARTPLAELSKGSSQKVAVVQALLAEPGLLVLDEAWTGLDVAARAELDRAVAERTAAGATVVFVDHDATRLADLPGARYRLRGGTLEEATEPPELRPGAAAARPAAGGTARTGSRAAGVSGEERAGRAGAPVVRADLPVVPVEPPVAPASALGGRADEAVVRADVPGVQTGAPGVPAGVPARGPGVAVVRIRAAGPPGSVPPPGAVPDAGGGILLTVGADRSDAVLRALLTARPPWHIRSVEELP